MYLHEVLDETCSGVLPGYPLNNAELIPDLPHYTRYVITSLPLMKIGICKEVLDNENIIIEQIKTTHAFPSFPGQSYSGIGSQVKSAWQSRLISSRPTKTGPV